MAAEHGAVNSPDKAASPQGKAATQDRILQAAMSLFMRRGYARTSVTQIASKAGVSRAAVFWHFSDKDTLFRAAAKQFVVPFREGLARHLRHLEPRKRIIELITYYEQFVEQNRPNIVAFSYKCFSVAINSIRVVFDAGLNGYIRIQVNQTDQYFSFNHR